MERAVLSSLQKTAASAIKNVYDQKKAKNWVCNLLTKNAGYRYLPKSQDTLSQYPDRNGMAHYLICESPEGEFQIWAR